MSIYFDECASENVSYLFQCGYTIARRNSLPEHFIFYISLDWVHLAMGNHVSWEFSMRSGNKFQCSYEHCLCHKTFIAHAKIIVCVFSVRITGMFAWHIMPVIWFWSHHKSILSPGWTMHPDFLALGVSPSLMANLLVHLYLSILLWSQHMHIFCRCDLYHCVILSVSSDFCEATLWVKLICSSLPCFL